MQGPSAVRWAGWAAGIIAAVVGILAWLLPDPFGLHDPARSPSPGTTSTRSPGPTSTTSARPGIPVDPAASNGGVDTTAAPALGEPVFLQDLQPTDQSANKWFADAAHINGELYARSIIMQPAIGTTPVSYVTYTLGRHYRRFRATAGVEDSSPSATRSRIEVFVDNRKVFSATARKGQAYPIDVNVSGAFELKLIVTALYEPRFGEAVALFWTAFGDGHVIGD